MRPDSKKMIPIRLAAFALAAVLMLASFAACGKKKAEELTGETIVASLGDESVNYALYKAAFENYAEYFSQMGYDPFSSTKELEGFQDLVIDALVNDMAVLHHAKDEGFTLSEEQRAEVIATANEELASIKNDYEALAQEAVNQDPSANVDEQFALLIAQMSEYYTGRSMTFEEYSEEYTKELLDSKLIEEFKASVVEQFNVTEAQITDWYTKQLETDTDLYTEHPEQFKTDMEYFYKYFGKNDDAIPVTYVPEGYERIFDIVVRPSGTIAEEYNEKLKELDSISDECSTLLFNDALNGNNANAERIAQLIEDYRSLKAETDEMYSEFTSEARSKIDEAFAALESGRDFKEVMLEYTEDEEIIGSDTRDAIEAYRSEGKLISTEHKSTSDWSDTVKEIFSLTERGRYSSAFSDDDGSLHIIFRGEEEKSGAVELDAIREYVEASVRVQRSESDWNELIDAWTDDTDLKIDMDIVRSLGRDKLKNQNTNGD